ncbi:unnamed protein product [Lota lota]
MRSITADDKRTKKYHKKQSAFLLATPFLVPGMRLQQQQQPAGLRLETATRRTAISAGGRRCPEPAFVRHTCRMMWRRLEPSAWSNEF